MESIEQLIERFNDIINDIFDESGSIKYELLKDLEDFFGNLGNIYDRKFEIKLTRIVEYYLEEKVDITKRLEDLLHNEKVREALSLESRFALFFLIFTYHRRMKNISQMERLLREFREDFSSIPLFKHLKIMFLKYTGRDHSLIEAMELAYYLTLDERVSEHTGILHNFAETIVEALERSKGPA